MAFCSNCGAPLAAGAKFCTECGEKCTVQASVPAQPTPVIRTAEPTTPAQEPAPQQAYTPAQEPIPQQAYTPAQEPVPQQAYTPAQEPVPQQTQAPAPVPKEKKPVNKTLWFIIGGAVLAVIIAVVLIFTLGGNKAPAVPDDPNVGIWNAEQASMMGIDMAVADVFQDGLSLELKNKGKCVLTVNGSPAEGNWTCEDGKLTLSGGTVNCTGTIDGNVLIISNMMDMGIDIAFVKEGTQLPAKEPTEPAATEPSEPVVEEPPIPDGPSPLQMRWNGTWYGVVAVAEATGAYESIVGPFFDATMVVDVNAEGEGDFVVFIGDAKEAFIKANCSVSEYGMDVVDGTAAGGKELNAHNWMFRSNPMYSDQYVISDEMKDEEGTFSFSMFMKKWGGNWRKEVEDGYACVPPSVDAYHTAIGNGEAPAIGYAPYDYTVESTSSTNPVPGTEDPQDTPATPETPVPGLEGPTGEYSYFDKVFVSYPSDSFYIDKDAILDTIAAKDASVKIAILVQWNETSHDDTMSYYDSYASYDGYETKDITVAGYDARMISYVGMFGDYETDVHVNFGEPISGYYGVNFAITSSASKEDCTSDTVMAILNSIRIAR